MKRFMALVGLTVLLTSGLAQAAVEQGDMEISLSGSYSKIKSGNDAGVSGPDYSIFDIMGNYDYFVTDNVSAGLGLGYHNYKETNGAGQEFRLEYLSLGARGKWHFVPDNELVPYLGLELNYNSALDIGTRDSDHSKSSSGWNWGPMAGLRYELNPNIDFFLEYAYLLLEGDWSKWSGLNVESQQMIRFGMIHNFN